MVSSSSEQEIFERHAFFNLSWTETQKETFRQEKNTLILFTSYVRVLCAKLSYEDACIKAMKNT